MGEQDLADRLEAFRQMLCVLVREELECEYKLNLEEMYLLIDAIPHIQRQAAEQMRERAAEHVYRYRDAFNAAHSGLASEIRALPLLPEQTEEPK